MLDIIIEYQIRYISLIEKFMSTLEENRDYNLLFDEIELLLKSNKKSILNYMSLENNYVYYGGATYFNSDLILIEALKISEKRALVYEPILKLSKFYRNNDSFKIENTKKLILTSITNTVEIKKYLLSGFIIFINPFDFFSELKVNIQDSAVTSTLNFLNKHLCTDFNSITQLSIDFSDKSFEDINKINNDINKKIITVNCKKNDTLEEKIIRNFVGAGLKKEIIEKSFPIDLIINTLVGLFGQAIELKSISFVLECPLYINNPNVLFYVNILGNIDGNNVDLLIETNTLFYLYQKLYQLEERQIHKISNSDFTYSDMISKIKKEQINFEMIKAKIDNYIKKYI